MAPEFDDFTHRSDKARVYSGTRLLESLSSLAMGFNATPTAPAAAAAQNFAGLGAKQQILQFQGKPDDPRVVSATMFAFDSAGTGKVMGPLVGIAEWSAGGSGLNRAEFDLPVPNYGPGGDVYTNGPGSGVCLSLPCSSLNLYAFNEANFIPGIGDLPIGAVFGIPFCYASLAVGNLPGTIKLTRTVWVCNASNAGLGLANNASTRINVPPFATAVRVLRSADATGIAGAIQVAQTFTSSPLLDVDNISVAAGAQCPTIPLMGGCFFIDITNKSGGGLTQIACVYDIGI
jgi:hypothetical protein